jgi:ABC-type glycerol-3-phosphate transport system substrate-binding protein
MWTGSKKEIREVTKMGKKLKAAALFSTFMTLGLFAGCSGEEQQADELAKGGYVESVMEVGSDVFSLSELELIDNKLTTFDSMFCNEYIISDDDSKVEMSVNQTMKKLEPSDGYLTLLARSENGYFISKISGTNFKTDYFLVSSDGEEKKLDIDDYITHAEYSESGQLFIVGGGNLCEVSESGSVKPLMTVGENVINIDSIGDNIIVIDEKGVHFYDIKNDKEAEAPKALRDFFADYINKAGSEEVHIDMCKAPNDSICIACSDGIYKYILNGNNVEQIVDGVSCSLGNPSLKLSSVYYCDDESIIVAFDEGTISRFSYDSEMKNSKEVVLKVYTLEKDEVLSQLINGYASQNREVKIDYQIGMKDGITYEDAMKDFTTQVLSGNAPDLIMLDGMNIDNYIDKNMLCDLSSFESEWNKDEKLLDNIVKWNKKGDKVYNVACKFTIPAIGADSDDLKKLNSLEDIAEYIKDNRKQYNDRFPLMYFEKPEQLVKTALMYENDDIFGSGKIDSDKLEKFFGSCYDINKNNAKEGECISYGYDGSEMTFADRLFNVMIEDHTVAVGTVNTFNYDLNVLESLDDLKNENNADYKFGTGKNGNVFVPKCNLGIIEAGKNHDEAQKFIAYALGAEPQKLAEESGFPVNTDALSWFYKKNENDINNFYGYDLTSLDESKTFVFDIKWITNKQAKEFDEFIRSLDTPFTVDKATEQIIVNNAIECMNDSISVSEAASKTVSQLEIKMKE